MALTRTCPERWGQVFYMWTSYNLGSGEENVKRQKGDDTYG